MAEATRAQVYVAIDTERAYQNALPPSRTDRPDGLHTVGEYVVMMQAYQAKLVAAWTENPGDGAALEVMRKLAGIAVRCMEQHGAPLRMPDYRQLTQTSAATPAALAVEQRSEGVIVINEEAHGHE